MTKMTMGLVVIGALAIAGCTPKFDRNADHGAQKAEVTSYKAGGLPKLLGVGIVVNPFEYPYGYNEDKLGERSYKVWSETSPYTSAERTKNIAMMRAAELGQQGGYTKFRVSYQVAGGICRDNTGFQRRISMLFVQYGRGDGAIGPDDAELSKEAQHVHRLDSRFVPVPVRLEYSVADVARELGPKVQNTDSTAGDRRESYTDFHDRCWGPS